MERDNDIHAKWVHHYRFRWHESILRDRRVRKNPTAIALAGHIMHRYRVDLGYAQYSANSASRRLCIPVRSIKRSTKYLWKLGWITAFEPAKTLPNHWGANRYALAGTVDQTWPISDDEVEEADDGGTVT